VTRFDRFAPYVVAGGIGLGILAFLGVALGRENVRATTQTNAEWMACRQLAALSRTRADTMRTVESCARWGHVAPFTVVVRK
jgi:hypothetical protein